ncbi:MAG: hypothetical protein C0497_14400 [Gemmatimonas sp.]|nr:hypothetical protein [Gemmatimonas sp.]
MQKRIQQIAIVGAVLALVACGDPTASNERALSARADLASAFTTVPVAYTSGQTTYNSSGEGTGPMFPGAPAFGLGPQGSMGGMGGMSGVGGMGGMGGTSGTSGTSGMGGMGGMDMGSGMGPMMGGGLGDDFTGGMGLGRDFGRGRYGDPALAQSTCTYDAAAKRAPCTPVVERGLTVTRSVAWSDAAGVPQSAFDSVTTNTINTVVAVSGSITRRDSATSTIAHRSDRTISGLAKGSTRRTVNGIAAGQEVTVGKDNTGTFSATRAAADTVRGIIVPVSGTGRTYPTAGTIIRVMNVSVLRASGTTTSVHREVITYDGTATAKMIITRDGTTKSCTLPLPMGRPTCS